MSNNSVAHKHLF